MKKIIWISSYPKSGNTWVRYFLSNYFFNEKKENSNLTILKNIDKFPPYKYLEKIVDKKILDENAYNISKYWLKIQSEIVKSKDRFIFLKNHNALVSIEGSSLTNEEYSLGIIYIVRDPRDVVLSYLNFSKTLNVSKAIERITSKNLYCHISKKYPLDVEILGSWKFNYLSWRDGVSKIPRIIIRYEDLINNTFETKLKIINFLSKLLDFKVDIDQIKFSINQSDFQRLKKLEEEDGFLESKKKFFNFGKIGQWKKNKLSSEQIDIIVNFCKDEMKELNYT